MMLSNARKAASVRVMGKSNLRGHARNRRLLSGLLAGGLLATTSVCGADTPPATQARAQGASQQTQPQEAQPQPGKAPASKSTKAKTSQSSAVAKGKTHPTRYAPDRFAGRAGKFYELAWGVDSLNVKLVESGELVRFSYRVLDPVKARSLNDKQSEASLIDPKAGVRLAVPTMEKVGQLRQTASPEAGRSYWMTFSNKGGHVVRGDRVDVVIGTFKGSFLAVD
jgi:hypothetical protein